MSSNNFIDWSCDEANIEINGAHLSSCELLHMLLSKENRGKPQTFIFLVFSWLASGDCYFKTPARKFDSKVITEGSMGEVSAIYVATKYVVPARWAQKEDSINSGHVQYIKHWWGGWLRHFFSIPCVCVCVKQCPRAFPSPSLCLFKIPVNWKNGNSITMAEEKKSWMINS